MEGRVMGRGKQGEGSTGEMPTWDSESSQRRVGLSQLLHYPRVQSHLPWSMKEVLAMMGHELREGPSPGKFPALNMGEGHKTVFLTSTHRKCVSLLLLLTQPVMNMVLQVVPEEGALRMVGGSIY